MDVLRAALAMPRDLTTSRSSASTMPSSTYRGPPEHYVRTPEMHRYVHTTHGRPKASLMFYHSEHAGRAHASNMTDTHFLWEEAQEEVRLMTERERKIEREMRGSPGHLCGASCVFRWSV